ncbi:MAG: LuxR C-terminal-related transcriptional regulator [Pararhodobacter sp.]
MTQLRLDGPWPLIALIAVQSLCAAVFVSDVALDETSTTIWQVATGHQGIELVASLSLVAAIALEFRLLRRLLERNAHLERQASRAAQAFHDLLEARLHDWGLTPAERDVAHFSVKGCSIAEIASLRGSAEGTVKAHLNAIYRKAGVANRAELLALLIEDLVR